MQLAAGALRTHDQYKSVTDTIHDRLRFSFSSTLCSIHQPAIVTSMATIVVRQRNHQRAGYAMLQVRVVGTSALGEPGGGDRRAHAERGHGRAHLHAYPRSDPGSGFN